MKISDGNFDSEMIENNNMFAKCMLEINHFTLERKSVSTIQNFHVF